MYSFRCGRNCDSVDGPIPWTQEHANEMVQCANTISDDDLMQNVRLIHNDGINMDVKFGRGIDVTVPKPTRLLSHYIELSNFVIIRSMHVCST